LSVEEERYAGQILYVLKDSERDEKDEYVRNCNDYNHPL